MKTRKVYPGQVHHVCQQTVGGVVVFYTLSDYLVYFTIFCTVARRYGLKVLALCPMVDHTHSVVVVPEQAALPAFVQLSTHLFSKEWNRSRGRKGPLFRHRYMSSAKFGNKQIRTTINYNNNNPVEHRMVAAAEDYRWNFLRYAKETCPFSSPFMQEGKRKTFRYILREMNRTCEDGGYLRFVQLERWKKKLSPEELQYLSDCAIRRWNVIDYEEVIRYYGDYETMLRSFHDNTGSDYEIREDRNNYSDAVYQECTALLLKEGYIAHPFEIPSLPLERKKELAELLQYRTMARPAQIGKFLHLSCGTQIVDNECFMKNPRSKIERGQGDK